MPLKPGPLPSRPTARCWPPAATTPTSARRSRFGTRPLEGFRGAGKSHTATVAALAFSPDGRLLASGSLDAGKPGHPNVILWDAASHQRLAILEGHAGWVRSVAFSPDGRLLATASDDGTARLWDVAEQKTRAVLEGHATQVNSIVFSPDGRLLATGSRDATVRLWDVATGRALATLSDDGNVFAVAFSPDGSQLASVNEEGAIKLWDPSQGALRPDHPRRFGAATLSGVYSRRKKHRGGGQGKGGPHLGCRHRPGAAELGGAPGTDQRPRLCTRWINPRLVRSPGKSQALARRADRDRARAVMLAFSRCTSSTLRRLVGLLRTTRWASRYQVDRRQPALCEPVPQRFLVELAHAGFR